MNDILKFDMKLLKRGLKKFSNKKRRLFCLSICDRLFPNYVVFHRKTKKGNADALKEIIDDLWNNIVKRVLSKDRIAEHLKVCKDLISEINQVESTHTLFARDAVTSIALSLIGFKRASLKKVVAVATIAINTVETFVKESKHLDYNKVDFEEEINKHPFMVRELTKQRSDVVVLKLIKRINPEFIVEFRALWDNQGKSNINLK